MVNGTYKRTPVYNLRQKGRAYREEDKGEGERGGGTAPGVAESSGADVHVTVSMTLAVFLGR